MSKNFFVLLVTSYSLLVTNSYAQEQLTITTYYPSPYGSYNELRANQMSIGSGYASASLSNGWLLVEDRVGIGINNPASVLHIAAADVNNPHLRVTNSAGTLRAWLGDEGGSDDGTLYLYNSAGTEYSRITEGTSYIIGGGFGLGISNPNLGKLHISSAGIGAPARIVTLETTNAENNTWRWMDFIRSGVDSEFIVYGAGDVRADGTFNSPADYAEYFYSEDITLKPGELVCIAGNNTIKRCGKDEKVIGVVSTKPGVLGIYAEDVTDAAEKYEKDFHWVKVGLLGQLPTKISVAHGVIKAGDQLTSGKNGVAIKGESPRTLLILALEDANKDGVIRALIK